MERSAPAPPRCSGFLSGLIAVVIGALAGGKAQYWWRALALVEASQV
jgi:hypothetical protein